MRKSPDLPIRSLTLDGGLRVVLCPVRGAPVVAFQIWVEVGSADERPEQGGLAHVHEHMLFKGTARRKVGEIASEIEAAGGSINAWTSYDQTVYHVVLASRFLSVGIDILADAIQNSAFDERELSSELEVILEEIKRSEDQPASRVSRAMFDAAFQRHPYKNPVIGQAEVVRGFTRDQVVAFYRDHYCKDRMTLVCVGDFDEDEVLAEIRRAFDGVRPRSAPLPSRAKEPRQRETRGVILEDDVTEAHLALAWHGPSVRAHDVAVVDVLSVLLGQGKSSRLNRAIRHDAQLVNEIYAYAYTPRDPGLIVIGAALAHEKIDGTVDAIATELSRLIAEGPSVDEVDKAQTILCSEGVYQRETVEGLARRLGFWSTMVGDPTHEATYQAQVRAVRPEDVQRACAERFRPEAASLVALVPTGAAASHPLDALKARLTRGLSVNQPRPVVKAATRPGPVRVELSSGATLVVQEDHTTPIVSARVGWLGGLLHEPEDEAGRFHLLGGILSRGTSGHDAEVFAERVDAMAGQLSGFSGRNSLGLRATFQTEFFDAGFGLLEEVLRAPAFAADELTRLQRLTLEELRARNDFLAGLSLDLFGRALWLSHPYRRDVLGFADTVEATSADHLRQLYAATRRSDRSVMAIVGDMSVAEATAYAERALSSLDVQAEPLPQAPALEPPPEGPRVARLVRDKAQAHLVVGHRGLALDDDDRFALEVLNAVLSGQGGRLFLELRDKQALCYSVSAFSVEGVAPGSFSVYMGTSPDKVDRALAGIIDILDEVVAGGIDDDELQRAQRHLAGTHAIGLQRLGARASTMMFNELYGLGFDAHTRYEDQIFDVTKENVRAVAERIMRGSPRVISIVGPKGTGGPEATIDPPMRT